MTGSPPSSSVHFNKKMLEEVRLGSDYSGMDAQQMIEARQQIEDFERR